MRLKNRLYLSQNHFYQSIQNSSRQYLGKLSPELKTYYQEYDKEFGGRHKKSNKNNLIDACLASSLILCGDFHSSPQAQRTVLRLLRNLNPELKNNQRPLYLCFEFLRARDNLWVQSYQRGQISESLFLKKIAFQQWGFNWQNYQPLFEFAKNTGLSILGLSDELSTSVKKRDDFMASVLVNWAEKNPAAIFLCLVGDWHLAQKNLPQKIKDQAKHKRALRKKMVIIHQNQDRLYLKYFRKKHLNESVIIELKQNIFCILNTPPWMKLQRHIDWLECQDPTLDNRLDNFLKMTEALCYFLKIPPKILGDGGDVNSPELCKNPNHLASQAAKRIHRKLSQQKQRCLKPKHDFFSLVWMEAIGCLGSKILNPERKVPGLLDFADDKGALRKKVASYFQVEREMAQSGLKGQIKIWRRFCEKHTDPDLIHLYQSVGKLLGEAIFRLMEKEKVTHPMVRKLFQTPFLNQSQGLYFSWLNKIDSYRLRSFSSSENL